MHECNTGEGTIMPKGQHDSRTQSIVNIMYTSDKFMRRGDDQDALVHQQAKRYTYKIKVTIIPESIREKYRGIIIMIIGLDLDSTDLMYNS